MCYLFVGLAHFSLDVVPVLVDLVDQGVELLAGLLSRRQQQSDHEANSE